MWVAPMLAWQALAHFDVTVAACPVDEAELQRLTTLEMRSVGAPTLAVSYRCDETDVVIGLRNQESEIRIERRAKAACCEDVELERTFALLAAGLFKAAGPALTANPEPPEANPPQPTPAPVPDPPPPLPNIDELPPPAPPPLFPQPAPRVLPLLPRSSAPGGMPAQPPDRPGGSVDHQHVVGVSGRVLALDLDTPELGFGAGLEYRVWPWQTIGFGGYARAAFLSNTHTSGTVRGRLIDFGAVGAWRFAQWTSIAVVAEAGGGLSLVSIEGQSTSDGFDGTSLFGATGHLQATLAPTVMVDRTQLALPLTFGGIFRAPRGLVETDDEMHMFQLDGMWAGAALRVSLGFGERQPSTIGSISP